VNAVQRPDSYGGDYTALLRRRWRIVVALTCVGLVGAFGYIKVTPAAYSATAVVYVAPTGAAHNNQVADSKTTSAVNLDTEAQLVTSGAVAGTAGHLMHSTQTPSQLAKQIAVTVPPNTQVLDVSCTASSGAKAAACANAFAQGYLLNRRSSATSWLNAQINALQDKVNALQQPVATLKTEISALPPKSSTRFTDLAKLNSDNTQLRVLDNQISALHGQAADVSRSRILTDASPSTRPDNPKKSLVLPSGFAAGLVLGLIAAFAWDRRDKRIRGAKDAERFLDLPVLFNRPNAFRSQASLAPVRSGTGQAFTELAHGVAAALGEGNRVLLVAGASPGPAGSVTAANLAAALARTHSEAVLVCTDRSSTVSPGILGLGEGRGLAEVMTGSASVREVARGPAAVPGLWVITPGADASLADRFMQHDRAQALVSQLRHDARYVIIEAQPAEDGADTFAFAEFADAALITVEAQRTTRTEGEACIRRLRQMRTALLGAAVLPPVRPGATVRPPQPQEGQLRAGARPGDRHVAEEAFGRGGAALGHGQMSSASGTATGASQDRDLARPGRSSDPYEEAADRIS
jgi:capsular polysaccharide biosynthesis protein